MTDLFALVRKAEEEGYYGAEAEAKVCQDVVLALISSSPYCRNITVKGGVVMRCLTDNSRRATLDMDLDFIKFSLSDESIDRFLSGISNKNIALICRKGIIEELRQQDYHGKRVGIELSDESGFLLQGKIDFGVHTHFDLLQEEFCFDVGISDDTVNLLINSKEQMLAEKIRSFLKFGPFSTRYKDIYDICYLIETADKNKVESCFKTLIYEDPGMRENNISDIIKRMEATFLDNGFRQKLNTSRKNWIEIDNEKALGSIIDFLRMLQ